MAEVADEGGSEGEGEEEEHSAWGLADLLAPLRPAAFLGECWGAKPHCTTLAAPVLRALLAGFGDGEATAILPHCRKPDNAPYNYDEMEAMERDLLTHSRTLDLPYCFTDGAHDLFDAWVRECAGLGHDVEVGVYMSNSHEIRADWHRDANHNFTIQLKGTKDWFHIPADSSSAGSRGMFQPPRNRAEQLARAPPAGLAGCECFSLAEGSVLYLPPGHWHRVETVQGPCVSVNLRIGHLPQARWLSEVLFASLAAAPNDARSGSTRHLGKSAMLSAHEGLPAERGVLATRKSNQFFRYTLHCDACVEPPFRKLLLPATGQALTLSHLLGSPDDSSKSMVLDVLRVLVYMRVLVSSSADKPGARAAKPGVVDGSGVGGSGASHPKAAAKRGRDEDDERAAADELDEDMNEGKGGLLRTV
ncbi:hypothetical protein T492DRAFT_972128 [Pavlovales sp. CCMP2436]|nr:hypothetical protein T492DRAFT_972128 [Pavlovales sp. CCMP2436]